MLGASFITHNLSYETDPTLLLLPQEGIQFTTQLKSAIFQRWYCRRPLTINTFRIVGKIPPAFVIGKQLENHRYHGSAVIAEITRTLDVNDVPQQACRGASKVEWTT